MSRSRRHTPIIGMTVADSEKQDKRLANRALRRLARVTLAIYGEEVEVMPVIRDVSNVWAFEKDGRQYLDNPALFPREMRK